MHCKLIVIIVCCSYFWACDNTATIPRFDILHFKVIPTPDALSKLKASRGIPIINDTLIIKGTTNFPDNTVISLIVYRINNNKWTYWTNPRHYPMIVKNGQFQTLYSTKDTCERFEFYVTNYCQFSNSIYKIRDFMYKILKSKNFKYEDYPHSGHFFHTKQVVCFKRSPNERKDTFSIQFHIDTLKSIYYVDREAVELLSKKSDTAAEQAEDVGQLEYEEQ